MTADLKAILVEVIVVLLSLPQVHEKLVTASFQILTCVLFRDHLSVSFDIV